MIDVIFDKCRDLGLYEERSRSDVYGELVFYTAEMQDWVQVLSSYLGDARKPAGVEPSVEDMEITRDFGGIYADQTLYMQEFDQYTIMVMLWPWKDHLHTTLKVARIAKG